MIRGTVFYAHVDDFSLVDLMLTSPELELDGVEITRSRPLHGYLWGASKGKFAFQYVDASFNEESLDYYQNATLGDHFPKSAGMIGQAESFIWEGFGINAVNIWPPDNLDITARARFRFGEEIYQFTYDPIAAFQNKIGSRLDNADRKQFRLASGELVTRIQLNDSEIGVRSILHVVSEGRSHQSIHSWAFVAYVPKSKRMYCQSFELSKLNPAQFILPASPSDILKAHHDVEDIQVVDFIKHSAIHSPVQLLDDTHMKSEKAGMRSFIYRNRLTSVLGVVFLILLVLTIARTRTKKGRQH